MRYFLKIIATFIIYTSYGQQNKGLLFLEVSSKTETNAAFLETLPQKKSFSERVALTAHIDTLKTKILENGYIDLQTTIQQKNDTVVTAVFDFGVFYENLQLSIEKDQQLASYISENGFTIYKDSIEIKTAFAKAYLKQLSSIAANSGNPFASFKITNLTKKNNTLKGSLSLSSSESRSIDKFVLKGYDDFPKGHLKHYARLKTGEPFNQKKLIQQNELLETLPFVSTQKDPEILFKKDSTIAYYYLKRNNVNSFDGFLGFASNDDNSLRLDGYLDLLLTNNLNYGESLSLNYKADGNDQSQLKVNAQLPYILNSPIGIDAEIALFRKDSTFSTSDLSTNLFYTISQTSTVGVGYQSRRSENLMDDTTGGDSNIVDFDANGAKVSYQYTKRQSAFFTPIKTRLELSLGYTERITNLGEQRQIPITLDLEHIFKLNETNGVYLRSKTQYLDSDNYVTNELFRFGGILSIRGFEENSLFANLVSIINTEYRLTLNQSIYVNSIIDLGYFENDISNQSSNLFSAGIGAGVRTRAGLLKINLANGKFENLPFRFSNTKLHIILQVSF